MIDSVSDTAGAAPDLKRARRRKADTAPQNGLRADRLPPHSPEAEQGVLGCVLLSPNDCLGQCIEKLRSGVEVFYDLRHQTIYSALVQMYDHREAIDVITLQQRLKDKQLLEEIGGMFGVTRERIRQLRDRALKRLKEGDVGRALASFAA